eukprot:TRINITY_DN1747_c0_g1_i2.p1 TRINITY_DN1747_c0_g1~~TRINITY_DN1747_c0_g1_i2.p1  ORF type:complete len:435 (+),score=76.81 TRINITY_DN1747_c0_g1_i2:109-1413(+)
MVAASNSRDIQYVNMKKEHTDDDEFEDVSIVDDETAAERQRASRYGLPCFPRWTVGEERLNQIVGVIIIMNAIVMGLETDMGESRFLPFEHFFCICYSLEMYVRLRTQGCVGYFSVPSQIFDACLVFVGILSLYIAPLLQQPGFDVSGFRFLKILRLARVLRILRIFRMFHGLSIIVAAFASAVSSVAWVGLLVLILDYTLAIVCTQLIGHHAEWWGEDEETIHEMFGSIGRSMKTLFIIMTLSSWDAIAGLVMKVYPPALVFLCFITYIIIASYTMVSLVTGIICDKLIAVQQADMQNRMLELEEEKMAKHEEVETLLHRFDTNHDGLLDKEEVKESLATHPELVNYVQAIGIDLGSQYAKEEFLALLTCGKDMVSINESADALVTHLGHTKGSLSALEQKITKMRESQDAFQREVREQLAQIIKSQGGTQRA